MILFEGDKQVLFTFPADPFEPNQTASSFVHFPHFLVSVFFSPRPKTDWVHKEVVVEKPKGWLHPPAFFFFVQPESETPV